MGKVVAAVGTAASHKKRDVAAKIEAAMTQAVKDALAAGVPLSDSKTILEWKMKAREKVLSGT